MNDGMKKAVSLASGNLALREGRYGDAMGIYIELLQRSPGLMGVFCQNIQLSRRQFQLGVGRGRQVAVGLASSCGGATGIETQGDEQSWRSQMRSTASCNLIYIDTANSDFPQHVGSSPGAIALNLQGIRPKVLSALATVCSVPLDVFLAEQLTTETAILSAMYALVWRSRISIASSYAPTGLEGDDSLSSIFALLDLVPQLQSANNLSATKRDRQLFLKELFNLSGVPPEILRSDVQHLALDQRTPPHRLTPGGPNYSTLTDSNPSDEVERQRRLVQFAAALLRFAEAPMHLIKVLQTDWYCHKSTEWKIEDVLTHKFKIDHRDSQLLGNLDRIDRSGTLFGWAAFRDSPERVTVAIVPEGGYPIEAIASTLRGDLLAKGVNDGRHGFDVSLPLYLCDGEQHRFDLFDTQNGGHIMGRTFLVERRPIDLYELRGLLEHRGALLLVCNLSKKVDLLSLAQSVKASINEDLIVVGFEYAEASFSHTRRYTDSGCQITILQCSPGLTESEVFLTLLRARVLSGFRSVMFVGSQAGSSEELAADVAILTQTSTNGASGISAREIRDAELDVAARELLADWRRQLDYGNDVELLSLRCSGLIRIEPAVLSEMSALDFESTAAICEALARENRLLELAFGFLAMLAKQGGLPVGTHLEGRDAERSEVRTVNRETSYIAFYLPQFHPIPENDKWWGKGFTEWRNVVRARPMFLGHDQPRVPADLGFYDLRIRDIQLEQVKMARAHGLSGFCYYYYWFDGVRLLNSPIDAMMQPDAPDFPFCICWANENWTRNWDGHNRHVLIQQNYSFESNRRFIREIIPFMSDPRYIRYAGRPMLIVYRILHMPDWTRTAAMWREECRAFGLGEIHLAAVRTNFDRLSQDPADYGLDSFVLFPPHEVRNIDQRSTAVELRPDYVGQLFGYDDVVAGDLERYSAETGGLIHRGAMMAWDNTARRMQHARIYKGATPMKFRNWLKKISEQEDARQSASNLIFINAWNEWAEGTYLEPDGRFGFAYLESLRSLCRRVDAINGSDATLVIGDRLPRNLHIDDIAPGMSLPDLRSRLSSNVPSHSEFRQGRQVLRNPKETVLVCAHYVGKEVFGGERSLLNVLEGLCANRFDVVTILPSFDNERYLSEVRSLSRSVYCVPYSQWQATRPTDEHFVLDIADIIIAESVKIVYVNTIVLHEPLVAARRLGIAVAIHVRELIDRDESLCEQIGLSPEEILKQVKVNADGIIANSAATLALFVGCEKAYLVNNCVSVPVAMQRKQPMQRVKRLRFGMISSNIPKKGLEDLVDVARLAMNIDLPVDFVNVGPINGYVRKLRSDADIPKNLKFIGYREGAAAALEEIDVLLSLSSFAESFGRTVAEALSAGKPVIGYAHGALSELVVDGKGGFLVPYRNLEAVIERISFLAKHQDQIEVLGSAGKAHVESKFSQARLNDQLGRALEAMLARIGGSRPASGCDGIADRLKQARPITVIVPIFNGLPFVKRCIESLQRYLPSRIASVVLVDDCSTDPELNLYLQQVIDITGYRLITNPRNLGYTKSVNIGMREAGRDDVILLNSDAEVTERWLAGLRVAAYSDGMVGTVTAMSDNAGAFSFPRQGERNEIPTHVPRGQISTFLLRKTGSVRPVEVNTGSGFCMYIRRALIDSVGYFDEEAFPRGYGEENDYCMRAISHGWKHVISPWTYVFHERTVSFGAEKERLVKDGVAVVMQRYPDYGRMAQDAFLSPAMNDLRRTVAGLFESVQH